MKNRRKILKELRLSLKSIAKNKPFVGIKAKDYYRGQWDAIAFVIEEIMEAKLYTKKDLSDS